MSAVLLEAEARRTGPVAGAGGATFALTRVEAARLLRHPLFLVAAALFLAPDVYAWATGAASARFPVLHTADRDTQIGSLFLVGAATFLVSNLAVLRPARHGTAAFYDVLLLPQWRRVLAHLLVVVPAGVAMGVLVCVRIVAAGLAPMHAGTPDPAELATGPIVVGLMGVLGVLMGTVMRSVASGPIALVALGGVQLFAMLPILLGASRIRWLLPVATEDPTAPPLPVHLLDRPAGAHVAYLLALTILLGTAALLRTGAGRGWTGTLAGVAAVAMVAAGIMQLRPAPQSLASARIAATRHPAAEQVCVRPGTVRYCYFPDFGSWVSSWDAVVQGVLTPARAGGAETGDLVVRQRVLAADGPSGAGGMVPPAPVDDWQADDAGAGTPGPVTVGTAWGTGEAAVELAVGVARRVVVSPGGSTASSSMRLIVPVCGGQAVLTLWLSGQASPLAEAGIRERAGNGSGGLVVTPAGFGTGWAFARGEVQVALSALDQPRATIATRVSDSWAELTHPSTSLQRAAELLGVPGPPPVGQGDSRC